MQTRHLTIMLTDIKGFTSKTASSSRTQVFEMIERHKQLVLPVVEKFKGTLVKTIGDAFLVTFDSPTDAVLCGIAIQDVLKAHNADRNSDDKIEIRIAINTGEVTLTDNDVYGDAVNITARIESIAEAGEVFFTEAVYLSMNKKEVPSSEIGYRQFKNVPEKIKVYRVLRETPIGEPDPLAAKPVSAENAAPLPLPAAPAAAAEIPAVHAPTAGIFSRGTALLLDLLIFLMAAALITGGSLNPITAIKKARMDNRTRVSIKSINIDDKGITVSGDKGKKFTLDDKGARLWENGKSSVLTDKDIVQNSGRGDGDSDEDGRKSGFPLKTLFWVIYLTVFLKRKGATLGMMLLKLRLIDINTGLTPKKTFWRSVLGVVSAIPLGLGYFWAIWEKDGRTWHDIWTGTKIVKHGV